MLFNNKQNDKNAESLKNVEDGYMASLGMWNDKLGAIVEERNHWRKLTKVSFTLNFVLLAITVAAGALVAMRPVEIVRYEMPSTPGAVTGAAAGPTVQHGLPKTVSDLTDRDRRQLERALVEYVTNLRQVGSDVEEVRGRLKAAYRLSTEPVKNYLNEQFQVGGKDENSMKNPMNRVGSQYVEVAIEPPNPLTDKSYQIEWVETTRNFQNSEITDIRRWRAAVTVDVATLENGQLPPRDNPLGLAVLSLSWNPIAVLPVK